MKRPKHKTARKPQQDDPFKDLRVEPTPDPTVTPFDLKCAQDLKQVITEKARLQRPFSKTNWAKEFAKLRMVDKVEQDRIAKVLDFHNKTFRENQYLPLVFSASGFRRKFLQIEAAMVRAQGGPTVEVEVSPEIAATVESLLGLYWPKDSKKDVPAACELTYQAMKQFRARLAGWYNGQPGKNTPWARLALWLLQGAMPNSVNFVEVWMQKVNSRVENWEDWSGNLLRLVPAPGLGDKKFNEWGRELAEEYSSGRLWDKLMGYVFAR